MLAIARVGFDGETFASGSDTGTSAVIQTDSPWAIPFIQIATSGTMTTGLNTQLQISPDNTNWIAHGDPIVGGTVTGTTFSTSTWGIPAGTKYVRWLAGAHVGANTVTVNSWVSMVTDMKRDFV
ncbi:MAG: hypothetical protein ACYS7Y_35025 [Planctomycetota bacterium]|jgi:hypothetical protein